jgi:hypothetical protein
MDTQADKVPPPPVSRKTAQSLQRPPVTLPQPRAQRVVSLQPFPPIGERAGCAGDLTGIALLADHHLIRQEAKQGERMPKSVWPQLAEIVTNVAMVTAQRDFV